MSVLILGLLLFLGAHSVRIVADGWRARTIARLGPGAWKGLYSLVSLAGFALIVWGWGLARPLPGASTGTGVSSACSLAVASV